MSFRMGAIRAPEDTHAPGAAPPPPVVPPPAAPAATAPPATPQVPVAPAAPAAAAPSPPPAPPAAPAGTSVELSHQAFNDRIAQAKRAAASEAEAKVLRDLGITDVAAGKARIQAAQAAEDAGKTQAQKDADAIARLTPLAAQAEEARATFSAIAADQMGALTEPQQAAVKALAGDDPAKQLNTIKTLRATWASLPMPTPPAAAAAPGTPPAPAAREPLPPPASTSAAGGAPPPANPGAPDHKAIYADLQTKNPMLAAQYALRHEREIYPTGGS